MEVYCQLAILAVFAIVCWRTMPPPARKKLLGVCLGLMCLDVETTRQGSYIIKGLGAFQVAGLALLVLFGRAMLGVARGRWRLPKEPVIALGLFVFCGAGFLVALGTAMEESNIIASWNIFWWARVCALGLVAFMTAAALVRDVGEFDKLLWIVCLSALVTAACLAVGVPQPGEAIGDTEINWLDVSGRLGGTALLGFWPSTPLGPLQFGIPMNAPQLGEFAMIGLAGSVAYFLGHPRPAARRMAGGCAVLLTGVIVLAQARGAFTGAVAGFVVSAVLMLGYPGVGQRIGVIRRIFIISGVVATLVVGISLWQFSRTDTGTLTTARASTMMTPGRDETLQGRIGLWGPALDLAVSKPLGSGFFASFEQSQIRNPHDFYLWLLLGTGWIGAAAFFVVLGRVCFILRAGLTEAPPERVLVNIAVLSMVGAVAVTGLTSVFFARAAHVTSFWVLMGAATAINLDARRGIAAGLSPRGRVLAGTAEAGLY